MLGREMRKMCLSQSTHTHGHFSLAYTYTYILVNKEVYKLYKYIDQVVLTFFNLFIFISFNWTRCIHTYIKIYIGIVFDVWIFAALKIEAIWCALRAFRSFVLYILFDKCNLRKMFCLFRNVFVVHMYI